MKNKKRAKRRSDLKKKYLQRLRKYISGLSFYINSKGEQVQNPIVEDVLSDNGYGWYFLKTTSRPCNCWACRKEKYKRNKKDNKFTLETE